MNTVNNDVASETVEFLGVMEECFNGLDPDSRLRVRQIKSEFDRIENYILEGSDLDNSLNWIDSALVGITKKLYEEIVYIALNNNCLNKEVQKQLHDRFDCDYRIILVELGEFLIKKATYG
jgi:hypothetical protein